MRSKCRGFAQARTSSIPESGQDASASGEFSFVCAHLDGFRGQARAIGPARARRRRSALVGTRRSLGTGLRRSPAAAHLGGCAGQVPRAGRRGDGRRMAKDNRAYLSPGKADELDSQRTAASRERQFRANSGRSPLAGRMGQINPSPPLESLAEPSESIPVSLRTSPSMRQAPGCERRRPPAT